jgi:translation initiation factor IF-2
MNERETILRKIKEIDLENSKLKAQLLAKDEVIAAKDEKIKAQEEEIKLRVKQALSAQADALKRLQEENHALRTELGK